jgi:sugar O-acyltransferase (sialic acid O-acetyltransferase NeuD family)
MADQTAYPYQVTIPLINPNEPEALLAALPIREGQAVSLGDLLCTLETTKSTLDLVAEAGGIIRGLSHQAGQIIRTGETLCYIADSPTWQPAQLPALELSSENLSLRSRITQPAFELAKSHGLDLNLFPEGKIITRAMVEELLQDSPKIKSNPLPIEFDPSSILVYGSGGHGKSLVELIRAVGIYSIIGFVDDSKQPGENILDLPVLGGSEILSKLFDKGVHLAANAVGGIGDIQTRVKIFQQLKAANFTCPTLVHPSAVVEPSAFLTEAVQIFPQAYVGSDACLGYGVIVNTGAIISHDCVLDDYVNISPGSMLAGEVHIGERTLVGMGVTINLQVTIGSRARIGNGATIKSDVPENGIVRAGSVWPE